MTQPATEQPENSTSAPVRLTEVEAGATVCVVAVEAGLGLQSRLAAMGIFPGTSIRVVQRPNAFKGPFIVRRGESRLMLGYGMAQKMLVKR